MSDEHKLNDDEKNLRKTGEFRVPPKTWVVWIAIIGGIIMLVLYKDSVSKQVEPLLPAVFEEKVDAGLIAEA